MTRQVVSSQGAPQAIGPYSQAIRAGATIYCSGQIPLRADGSLVDEGIEAQTRQVLVNLQAVLRAAGSGLADVVKTTVYLRDLGDFQAMNAVYAEFFDQAPPARATVEVSRLPKDVNVEIDCVAVTA